MAYNNYAGDHVWIYLKHLKNGKLQYIEIDT